MNKVELSELTFHAIVETTPSAIVLINSEGKIAYINSQTEKLFGYTRSELIGQQTEILIPERYKAKHPHFRKIFFEAPSTRSMGEGRELFAVRKDKTEFPVEIGLNPLVTTDTTFVLASIIDISERKIQEKTIKQQLFELELKNKELEHFAYITSHDLQEPLRTVSNFIKIIEEDATPDLDPKISEYLGVINFATNRMSFLVKALLDFSHLGKNKVLAKTDLNQLLAEVMHELDDIIVESDAKIIVGHLPLLNVYAFELRLLFQNLIVNAIKFSKKDNIPEIQIGCDEIAGEMQFYVKDNGIGIQSIYFERIFNIFQKLHSEKEYKGNGIGLANCKKIVELHGGKIWITSELNVGTTIFFTLNDLYL